MTALTADRLRELLEYDPGTGVFRWRIARRGSARVGSIAGTAEGGAKYWAIRIDGKRYRAHRLAWLYVNGAWPEGHLDHGNLAKRDNGLGNLRPATRLQNAANKPRYRNNRSGYKGVSRHASKWMARIQMNGTTIYLGVFRTPEDAHAAYCAKAVALFGEFANDGSGRPV